MTDVHSKETRSYNMSRIKAKNTTPEMKVRKALFSEGFRYKLHDKKLSGKPDIVLPRYKTIIFVHGSLWHGHTDCKYYVIPKTLTKWWQCKIEKNILNYNKNISDLKESGWKVIILWECQSKKDINKIINELTREIRTNVGILS